MPRLVARAAAVCRGCGRSTRHRSFCDDCRPARAARPSASRRGYDHGHRQRREKFLAEHPTCMHRDAHGWRDCRRRATELDHVIPGGADDESNYEGLCKPHHSSKTARQSSGWGAWR